jgi:hypothetical protein
MRRKRLSGAISAVVAGCVLAGALATAGPASAASRRWTVLNHNPYLKLELVSATPWEDNPFGFEGRPDKGSEIAPDGGRQHFELKYGANYQALLKYRIHLEHAPTPNRKNDYVEYWINNRLDLIFASCRFIDGHETTDWSRDGHHHFGSDSDVYAVNAYCGITSALGIGARDVWFSNHPADVRPPQ